jgi:hypothetical protein
MPRQPRLIVPGVAVHVRHRGNDGRDCFLQDKDRLVYLANLFALCRKSGCALHAFCLMTNHVHLLLTPPAEDACAKPCAPWSALRSVLQPSPSADGHFVGRALPLVPGRIARILPELSPVHRDESRARWPFVIASGVSMVSHSANSGLGARHFLRHHCEYQALSDDAAKRPAIYRSLFDANEDQAFLKAIRSATNGGYALMGDQLKAHLAIKPKHRLESGKPGRRPAEEPPGSPLSLELGLCPDLNRALPDSVRGLLRAGRKEPPMPEKRTLERARRKARQGKSASTVAGEFVRKEIEEIRRGKHGARSAKQAIAIGLSKARRAGVPLAGKGKRTKKRPSASHLHGRYVSKKRSRASTRALRREPRRAASHRALSRQARKAARTRAARR